MATFLIEEKTTFLIEAESEKEALRKHSLGDSSEISFDVNIKETGGEQNEKPTIRNDS